MCNNRRRPLHILFFFAVFSSHFVFFFFIFSSVCFVLYGAIKSESDVCYLIAGICPGNKSESDNCHRCIHSNHWAWPLAYIFLSNVFVVNSFSHKALSFFKVISSIYLESLRLNSLAKWRFVFAKDFSLLKFTIGSDSVVLNIWRLWIMMPEHQWFKQCLFVKSDFYSDGITTHDMFFLFLSQTTIYKKTHSF